VPKDIFSDVIPMKENAISFRTVAVAVIVVLLNRKTVFQQEHGITDVLMSEQDSEITYFSPR